MADATRTGRAESPQARIEKDDKGVQSIERALDIIETLSTEQKGLGVTEISKRIGLHKSTTHRLLATLAHRGYAAKREDGGYQLGLKLIEAVSCYINSLELQTEARPYVAQITAELGLTAHLGVLEGDRVVYIERMDVFSGIKLYSQIGLRMHAYCSSLGKCLLSGFGKAELQRVLANCSFNKFTPNTLSSFDALYAELKQVRARGFAVDNLEYSLNNRCIGAPIFDYRGEIIAAISASGPPTVLTEDRVLGVAEHVKAKALAISHNLGYVE
ncbi:MAG: IclR family transcriptional regulator [Clostridiales Family XIII bacterium]|nr:IclR family transcriptional regulator [Clostridiales Family XIII bacterium]